MKNHELAAFAAHDTYGLSKLEYISALIYAHGDLDAYESAKGAIVLLQACEDISKALREKGKMQPDRTVSPRAES